MEQLATAIGILGVIVNLTAYGLLSSGRLQASQARYQLLNILGTTGILISLAVQWNLPSFMANIAWLAIGVVAWVRIVRKGRRP